MINSPLEMKVLRSTVRDQAVEKLRTAIISGHLRPGQRLVEKELCEQIGVSRTSVREALRLLEGEKLIHAPPHKGPCVALPTAEEAEQIYEIRALLERLAGNRAARNASDGEIAQLNAAVDAFALAVKRRKLGNLVELANDFYNVLFAASHSMIATDLLRSLNARISFMRAMSMSAPGRAPRSLMEMRAISKAVARRDPKAAGEACARHVAQAARAGLLQLSWKTVRTPQKIPS